jgi:hypothetical protein
MKSQREEVMFATSQSSLESELIASIATQDTDAELATHERDKGAAAAREGKHLEDCPWKGGRLEGWWKEGFENPYAGLIGVAQ